MLGGNGISVQMFNDEPKGESESDGTACACDEGHQVLEGQGSDDGLGREQQVRFIFGKGASMVGAVPAE